MLIHGLFEGKGIRLSLFWGEKGGHGIFSFRPSYVFFTNMYTNLNLNNIT